MSARHIEIAGCLGEMRIKGRHKMAGDDMGKPALPHGVSGKPQRVEGARRNTPPTAFRFESYAVNTGEPGRDVKEGGE
jgi:hypothetical protein